MTPYSLDAYRDLVRGLIATGRRFASFTDPGDGDERVLLRHDVDFSLAMAVELARVNAELGVAGTFCVLPRSAIYNLASPSAQMLLAELRGLGQHLALHWDAPQEASDLPLETHILVDFARANASVADLSPAFSIHAPPPSMHAIVETLHVPGLTNMSSARFTQDLEYRSDSNLRYSIDEWRVVLHDSTRPLHLLFHPLNWVIGGTSMQEILAATAARLLQDGEVEFQRNSTWARAIPDGLPLGDIRKIADIIHNRLGPDS